MVAKQLWTMATAIGLAGASAYGIRSLNGRLVDAVNLVPEHHAVLVCVYIFLVGLLIASVCVAGKSAWELVRT